MAINGDEREIEVGDGAGPLDTSSVSWHLADVEIVSADVEILIDGDAYMTRWLELLRGLGNSEGIVLHSAWRLSNVPLNAPREAAMHRLYHQFKGDPPRRFFVRLSGHAFTLSNLRPFLSLKARRVFRSEVYPYIDQSFASRVGSYHQKSTCFIGEDHTTVMLGSLDMTRRRLDTPAHTRRSSAANRPSHDVGVVLYGKVAQQIAESEIDLWVLSSYYRNRILWPFRTPKRGTPEVARRRVLEPRASGQKRPSSALQCDVQILRTRSKPTRAQSWPLTVEEEESVKAAYLQAMRLASKYIYIEDQYFTPNFGDAAYGSWPWFEQASPMSELKRALRRKVRLFVVLPGTDPNGPGIRAMRDNAIDALRDTAAKAGAPAPLFVHRRTVDDQRRRIRVHRVHVHSKVFICDDEYAIVGSQNINVRSFTNDVELAIGMTGTAVVELRQRLWAEHVPTTAGLNWRRSAEAIAEDTQSESSRFVHYETRPRPYPPRPLRRRFWRLSETRRDY